MRIYPAKLLKSARVTFARTAGKGLWPVFRSVGPLGLLRLYRSSDASRAFKGSITWTGAPTITEDGVLPGSGPVFSTITRGIGKVLAFKIKMTKSSSSISGDEHVFGPLYVRNGALVAKVDTEEYTHTHSWSAGDILTVKIVITSSSVTITDI